MDPVRKWRFIVLVLCVLFTLAGCSGQQEVVPTTQSVITTEPLTEPTETVPETTVPETEPAEVTEPAVLI